MRKLLLLSAAISANTYASTCTQNEIEWVQKNYGVHPEESIKFAHAIQKSLRMGDSIGISEMMSEDMIRGPRAEAIAREGLQAFASDSWIQDAATDKPSCAPFRGAWQVNNIHYTNTSEGWKIVSMTGIDKDEYFGEMPLAWVHDDKNIPPSCLSRPWSSYDNYQEVATHFGIKNEQEDDFLDNPGKYLGKQIDKFNPIKPSWYEEGNEYSSDEVYLARYTDSCDYTHSKPSIEHKGMYEQPEKKSLNNMIYEIIRKVPKSLCNELSPNMSNSCSESYFILRTDITGGSKWSEESYGIYGLFEQDDRAVVSPLKFFASKGKGLDFIDKGIKNEK